MRQLVFCTYNARGALAAAMYRDITEHNKDVHIRFIAESRFNDAFREFTQSKETYNKVIVVDHLFAPTTADQMKLSADVLCERCTNDKLTTMYKQLTEWQAIPFEDRLTQLFKHPGHIIESSLWEVPGHEKILTYSKNIDQDQYLDALAVFSKKKFIESSKQGKYAIGNTICAIISDNCLPELATLLLQKYKIAIVISMSSKSFYLYHRNDDTIKSQARKLLDTINAPYLEMKYDKCLKGSVNNAFLEFTKKLAPTT